MAKTASKSAAKAPKKTAAKTSTPKAAPVNQLEKVTADTLDKLKSLNIEQDLRNDLEWCLGSYRADNNPVGLIAVLERAVVVLKSEKDKKTKGVTAKTITDLEKAIQR